MRHDSLCEAKRERARLLANGVKPEQVAEYWLGCDCASRAMQREAKASIYRGAPG